MCKESGYIIQRTLTIMLPRRRKRGRLERMFIDVVKEDIQKRMLETG